MKKLIYVLLISFILLGIVIILPQKNNKIITNEKKINDLSREFIISKTNNNLQIITIKDKLSVSELKKYNIDNKINYNLLAINIDSINMLKKVENLWRM